jgi:hypothetical protein
MSQPVLTAQDLIAWLEKTSTGWRQLLLEHPELLAMACDIVGVKTVAELLQHIVAVELRYAERLADLPVSDYADIPFDSVETIYATHNRAMMILKQLLASDIDWDAPIEYATRTMGRPAPHARPSSSMRSCTAFDTTRSLLHLCGSTALNRTALHERPSFAIANSTAFTPESASMYPRRCECQLATATSPS